MSERIGLNQRIKTSVPATLKDSLGIEAACVLVDISAEGFRARLDCPVELRSFDRLINGGREYEIDVRWCSGKELGGVIL